VQNISGVGLGHLFLLSGYLPETPGFYHGRPSMNDGKPSNKHGWHEMNDGRLSHKHEWQGMNDGKLSNEHGR
jgi:hypothetical protein